MQDGGISPAATAVRTWKLLPRRKCSGSRLSPSRRDVARKQATVQRDNELEKINVMNKQILTILIGLLWASNIFGQVQYDVKKVLETKNFVAFKKFADNLSNKKKMINSHWECFRDLTTDFKEGVFLFENYIPNKDNPSISSVYSFRVTLVVTEKSIVYYDLNF